jgi:hypothetical protein
VPKEQVYPKFHVLSNMWLTLMGERDKNRVSSFPVHSDREERRAERAELKWMDGWMDESARGKQPQIMRK